VGGVTKKGLTKLVFLFVPGHAGVRRKERANRSAESTIVGVDRQWIEPIF
jgi:hypothetical protein